MTTWTNRLFIVNKNFELLAFYGYQVILMKLSIPFYIQLIMVTLATSIASLSTAQNQAIGEWDEYLSFGNATAVTGDGETVYFGNEVGYTKINPDRSIEFFSTPDGLNDVDITAMAFSTDYDVLIIGYNSGNIDLVYNDEIILINDIEINNNIITGKNINDLFVDGSLLYISAGFGFAVLDLESGLFPVSLNTSFSVNQSTVLNDRLFISTDNGVYSYVRSNGNQADLNNWDFLDEEINISGFYESKGVASFNNELYVDVNDELIVYDGVNSEIIIEAESGFTANYVYSGSTGVFYSRMCNQNGQSDNCTSQVFSVDNNRIILNAGSDCIGRNTSVYQSPEGITWYGDRFDFYRVADGLGTSCQRIEVNRPRTTLINNINLIDSALWVTAGGVDDTYTYKTATQGTYVLADGQWDFINENTYSPLKEFNVRDHYETLQHPDGRIFISTARGGLLEYDPMADEIQVWDRTTSIISGAVGDESHERILGMQLDENGDLWMTNFLAQRPIVVYRSDGSWDSFTTSNSTTRLHTMVLDDFGNLWMADAASSNGIVVYNIESRRFRSIRETSEGLPSNRVISITKDREGAIWVGTDAGIAIFNCGQDPVGDTDCNGLRPRITQDGFLAFLLRDQFSNTIAVDAANRKWIGTNNGVFVVSEDGTEQIEQYTTRNSPLISDGIIDIEIDDNSGQVYIGTEKGIMSIRGAAVTGGRTHSAEALVYPNPVPPDYSGLIAIRGLAEESAVKIVDTQGRLVFETRSLGGQAVWDGRDFSGREVQSGVYYVLGSTTRGFDSTDGIVTEIAIVR